MEQDPTREATRLEVIGLLRTRLLEVMPDAETLWNQGQNSAIAFRGHLTPAAQEAYTMLKPRFAEIGFTPIFRRQDNFDLVMALPKVFKPQRTRWAWNAVLFVITLFTTTFGGAQIELQGQLIENPMLLWQQPGLLVHGIPAALTIMSILGVHELAHYFAARKHKLDSSLPFFIPVPSLLGTFGAIIRIRSPWENRQALFDVGIAGPLAGFLVAIPIFFFGLLTSPIQPPTADAAYLGSPLLLQWLEQLVYLIRDIPEGYDIYANAMTFAAWFGLYTTGINLIPVGQLDGGHIAYAVLGNWARALGLVVLVGLLVLGATTWSGWFVWAAFILFSGWQHPAPLNTLAPLGKKRLIGGVLMFGLLVLLFTPAPFVI